MLAYQVFSNSLLENIEKLQDALSSWNCNVFITKAISLHQKIAKAREIKKTREEGSWILFSTLMLVI